LKKADEIPCCPVGYAKEPDQQHGECTDPALSVCVAGVLGDFQCDFSHGCYVSGNIDGTCCPYGGSSSINNGSCVCVGTDAPDTPDPQ